MDCTKACKGVQVMLPSSLVMVGGEGVSQPALLALGIHPSWRLQDDRRFVSGLSTVFSAEAMADCCQFSQILIRRSD